MSLKWSTSVNTEFISDFPVAKLKGEMHVLVLII